MKKNQKIILITVVSLIIVAIIVYFIVVKIKKNKEKKVAEIPVVEPMLLPAAAKYTNNNFPLKLWSGGSNVKDLQRKLNIHLKKLDGFDLNGLHYESLVVDGKFGMKTNAACIRVLSTNEVTEEQLLKL